MESFVMVPVIFQLPQASSRGIKYSQEGSKWVKKNSSKVKLGQEGSSCGNWGQSI